MEGSAKIISLIARDENQHLAITQNILNKWAQGDDPEMKRIMKEEEEWTYKLFDNAVNEEKRWADYLFKDGSMIGLNDKLLQQYVEWIANRRLKAIGLKPQYDIAAKNNPLPWTQHWISSKGLQVAPQETEVESYLCCRWHQTGCQKRHVLWIPTLMKELNSEEDQRLFCVLVLSFIFQKNLPRDKFDTNILKKMLEDEQNAKESTDQG